MEGGNQTPSGFPLPPSPAAPAPAPHSTESTVDALMAELGPDRLIELVSMHSQGRRRSRRSSVYMAGDRDPQDDDPVDNAHALGSATNKYAFRPGDDNSELQKGLKCKGAGFLSSTDYFKAVTTGTIQGRPDRAGRIDS